MSDHDPYAPVTEYAKTFDKSEAVAVEPEVIPVEPEPTVEEAIEVPDGSAKDVLAWVGEDVDKAKAALSTEEQGQKRSTLITKLTAIID